MIEQAIIDFIEIGIRKQNIAKLDRVYKTNQLLALLQKKDFVSSTVHSTPLPLVLEVLDKLVEYAVITGTIEDSASQRDVLEAKIMDLVTPLPSKINDDFWTLYENSPKEATDYFYWLSQSNNYIKTRSIAKNIHFLKDTEYGELEITINLSKPEKDSKEIARTKNAVSSSYPACLLCIENEGYEGHLTHPGRANHRLIRMSINHEIWGFQYSPYSYYNEHAIFLSEEHRPMKVKGEAYRKLLSIVETLPHYFVGSNAGLPIVGGSILSHDHYQGGRHIFPMEKAKIVVPFSLEQYPEVESGIIKWPMSVIRLKSKQPEKLVEAGAYILNKWEQYSDESVGIRAYSGEEPHNAITPIARQNKGVFELDLVLRNNRTSTEFPDGIFHPHPDVQHIKKENIGLIEVMGLAILPPRLKSELIEVEKYVLDQPNTIADYHRDWAEKLKTTQPITEETVGKVIQESVGAVFLRVLEDAGVYKTTEEGKAAFKRFIETL
ncbi:UDP-glucose--hexose-1-phosphate uridylyltransferase [Desemzia sp. RIT804]|uniref:UDP-glucose--hexose-1-phosphate uridylyltransferase n=1 Tax=Desemzia sp. RIT 804 TaxID=2810209 RepID=UPI001950C93B|nr:UDP-glucose--hexose-1-phosphate uridylyltransferase [Desemzia sp. RIT 804]